MAQRLNLFFLVLFFLTGAIYYKNLQHGPAIVIQLAAVILLQLFTLRIPDSTVLKDFVVPASSILVVFNTLTDIVPAVNPQDIDYILIKMDYQLLGLYPTRYLERFQSRLLTDILHIGYISYYFLPFLLGVSLKLRKMEKEFQHGLFLILLCFYLSYIGYILFPALGPRYRLLHETELQGLLIYNHLDPILNYLEGIKRDAFPSGHTAITLLVLHLGFKYHKRVFLLSLPFAVLLLLSTVYLRYHYVVDVIAGAGLYLFTIIVGNMLWRMGNER